MSNTYLKLKREAYSDIDNYLDANVSEDIILYKISKKYGFGKKFVSSYLELLHTLRDKHKHRDTDIEKEE